ncbi:Hypothetical Protein FCC1311_081002 [Hondaea fermentalgiana]|uniref:Uncharacterized protein n=1 Tax=Hondaea fermentalgiana TaxID=2315210 RepID=A0A2R5GML9_9STRA|nr:Hypothetical Protein FCC1311_081002 [Hondaea fermentalgiana]|eukprot:GBG31875.1 Hypothetical Protein FCC1311_081002 [Hondaea fermentalgiana]
MQTQLQYQLMSAGGNWAGMSPHSLDTVEIDTLEDCDRINFLESSFRNYIEARDEELKEELQNPTETLSTKLRHGDKMFDEFLKDNSLRCSSLQSIASLVELMKENKQRRLEAEVDEEANFLQNADAFHNAIEADLDADANEKVDEDDVDEEGELGKELGAGRDSYDL